MSKIIDTNALQTFWNGFKDKLHIHSNKKVLDNTTASYTTAEQTKLSGIATGANKYTHPSTHDASMITGLSNVAKSGNYNDLSNKPTSGTSSVEFKDDALDENIKSGESMATLFAKIRKALGQTIGLSGDDEEVGDVVRDADTLAGYRADDFVKADTQKGVVVILEVNKWVQEGDLYIYSLHYPSITGEEELSLRLYDEMELSDDIINQYENYLYDISITEGNITFYANERPTVVIPVVIYGKMVIDSINVANVNDLIEKYKELDYDIGVLDSNLFRVKYDLVELNSNFNSNDNNPLAPFYIYSNAFTGMQVESGQKRARLQLDIDGKVEPYYSTDGGNGWASKGKLITTNAFKVKYLTKTFNADSNVQINLTQELGDDIAFVTSVFTVGGWTQLSFSNLDIRPNNYTIVVYGINGAVNITLTIGITYLTA